MAVIAHETGGSGLRSGLIMSVAMMAWVVNDTIAKWIGAGLGVGQFMFVRGLFASLLLLAGLWYIGRIHEALRILEPRLALRGFLDFVSTGLFIFALFHLPIGDLNALQQASPIVAAVLAWMLLGERFGWRRFVAIIAGFVGVLLVVKPGMGGFDTYTLAGLGSLLCSAFRDVVTRRIATDVSSMAVALSNAFVVGLGGFAIALFEGFVPMTAAATGVVFAGATFLVVGYFLFVLAIRTGDIASTAPFRYTVIIWSVISGYLVFGEVPDAWAFLGFVLIIAAGIFTIYRTNLRAAG